jgi:hypothetical protein
MANDSLTLFINDKLANDSFLHLFLTANRKRPNKSNGLIANRKRPNKSNGRVSSLWNFKAETPDCNVCFKAGCPCELEEFFQITFQENSGKKDTNLDTIIGNIRLLEIGQSGCALFIGSPTRVYVVPTISAKQFCNPGRTRV